MHLCLSSHGEVLYRDEEDFIMGFNSLALAVWDTDSRLLAEGFITTHNHKAVQTDNYKELIKRDRYTYTRYFNAKYHRQGKLGARDVFVLPVEGIHHTQVLLNYVIRQAVHHGLAATPFEYEHCSANCFFRKALGKDVNIVALKSIGEYSYLPEHKKLPSSYKMLKSGLIVREDVIDTSYVEEIYITPRNFLYQMNRITDEKVLEEQKTENKMEPVSLALVEKGVQEFDVQKALINEQGRVNHSAMTDIELCSLIDNVLLPRFLKESDYQSVYSLPVSRRNEIGNLLYMESKRFGKAKNNDLLENKTVSVAQIRRCLAL